MDDYDLQNSRFAAQFARDVRSPEPSYDDYELGNERGAAQFSRTIQGMAQRGRGTDTAVAHVTPGDIVVPRDVWVENPTILNMVKKGFDKYGDNYETHMVGSGAENINPETGLPEFAFFGKIGKMFGGGSGGGILGSVLGGGGGGPLASMLGGGIVGNLLMGGKEKEEPAPAPAPTEQLDISRPDDMALPGSLGQLGNLSDVQRTSNIATQGVEGQGSSPEAEAYFLNQIRRRLTDDNSTADEVNPIEGNYLQRMGVAYKPGDVKSILEGIARRDNAAKTLTT